MIICAALKIKNSLTIIGCCRHGDGYSTLHDLCPKLGINDVEEGFLTSTGVFLSRKEAFYEASKYGQLSATVKQYKSDHGEDELYSEDLY